MGTESHITVVPLWDDLAMEVLVIQSIETVKDEDLEAIATIKIKDKDIGSVLELYAKFKVVFKERPQFLEAIKSKQESAAMDDRKNNLRALIENISKKLEQRKAGIKPEMPKIESALGQNVQKTIIKKDPKLYEKSTVMPLWDDPAMEALVVKSIENLKEEDLERISKLVIEEKGIDSILDFYVSLKTVFKGQPTLIEAIKCKQEAAEVNDRKKNLRAFIANVCLKLEARKIKNHS